MGKKSPTKTTESSKIDNDVYKTFKELADRCLDPNEATFISFKIDLGINLIVHDAIINKTKVKIKTFEYANFKSKLNSPIEKLSSLGGLFQTIPLEFGVEKVDNRKQLVLRQVLPIHIPRQNFANKNYEYDIRRSSIAIQQLLATTDKDIIEEKVYEFQKAVYEFLFTYYNVLSVRM